MNTKHASHTPGPWKFSVGDVNAYHMDGVEDLPIAEAEANARLIAAAPEMYALLHAVWAKTDPSKDFRTCRAISELLDRIEGGEK